MNKVRDNQWPPSPPPRPPDVGTRSPAHRRDIAIANLAEALTIALPLWLAWKGISKDD